MNFKGEKVLDCIEKLQVGKGWNNGVSFLLEPKVKDYIEGDEIPFEGFLFKAS